MNADQETVFISVGFVSHDTIIKSVLGYKYSIVHTIIAEKG